MNDFASEKHAELLSRVDFLSKLDRVTLAKLAARLEVVQVAAGDAVVRQGDLSDSLYIIAAGSLGVFVSTASGMPEKRVGTLGRGEPFGEMSLLNDQRRSATVRAETHAEVLRLPRARFQDLVLQEPGVALSIAATLSKRLRTIQLEHLIDGPDPVSASAVSLNAAQETTAAESVPRHWVARYWHRAGVSWAFGVLVLFTGWLSPTPEGLSASGWHAIVTLSAIVPLLAVGALPEGIIALLLAAIWVIGGVAPASLALGGFATSGWVLVVSVLAIGAAISASGVLYRLALWAVIHARGGYFGQAMAIGIAGLLVGPAAPNATSRVTLIAPALSELVEALGYKPQSRAGVGLAMAALVGFGQMTAVFLTSSTTAVLVYSLLPEAERVEVNWLVWTGYGLVMNGILLVGLMAFVVFWYRPRIGDTDIIAPAHGALNLQRTLLGRPSRKEKSAVVVTLGLLLGFVTQPLHGVDPAWIAVTALTALAATRVVTASTLGSVNWSFALLFGVLASLVKVFSETKVDTWIANLVTHSMRDFISEPVLFLSALTITCFAVSFVLRWQAAAPLLTIALVPVAITAEIHPVIIAMVTVIACNVFFLPFQSTVYLALYHGTREQLFTHAQARPLALAYAPITLVAVCASIPFWHALGLL